MKLNLWRNALPKAEVMAKKIGEDVAKELAKVIEQKADEWIGENKLVHAGAAMKLAKELRQKVEK